MTASIEAIESTPRWRFSLRTQLIVLFTACFTVVFAAVFGWVYRFTTDHATARLRADLNETLAGAATAVDGDELLLLYRDGRRNGDGFSDDPRYEHQLSELDLVHQIEPRAWPYTFVRGDQPDTRREGRAATSPEFIYLVDANARHDRTKAARFLEPDTGSAWAVASWNEGKLVERPGLYADRFGSWMTSYAPVRDRLGHVVAVLGIDFEASYVQQIQKEIRSRVALVLGATYVVLLVLVYFAAGVFARPVLRLTRATEALREDTLGTAIAMGQRGDELGALARAFNRMSQRLARAFHDLATANAVLEDRVVERTAELAAEKEKSERLLHNVLPAEIAERLKREPAAIADGFEAVTVLFADIVGFTDLSSRAKPIEIVRLLNEIFSAFDELTARHGLEKIKTIGDAYMVVGGLPVPRPDHVIAVADMALDMQGVMKSLEVRYPGLAIRIGIHTGPVVAGVLGTHKFSYDLWGDTVNVASRMESHGERGRIQVSGAVAEGLKALFELEERGSVTLKGRGPMTTFWLLRRRP